ncbi:hypothetical protein [Cecembia lonarensis]|uniref:Uncharacterized protein n=1 Tax=Cecembia lonarensis (strain CCUG 58316 / KCTC 22772 / LW9) TaxID=1225176 RepID=K1LU22_CECL9|nr:hypothetical protein [Cecembia lonarensis]EKB47624.1 hypothetical protein B879_03783 [Cecembia lonarensis LW9]
MIQQIPVINPEVLDKRLRIIEQGIEDLKNLNSKIPKSEWLSLDEFKEATGIKSHYYIQKMQQVAKKKGDSFASKILGKKMFIHEKEVQRFFDGFYQV